MRSAFKIKLPRATLPKMRTIQVKAPRLPRVGFGKPGRPKK